MAQLPQVQPHPQGEGDAPATHIDDIMFLEEMRPNGGPGAEEEVPAIAPAIVFPAAAAADQDAEGDDALDDDDDDALDDDDDDDDDDDEDEDEDDDDDEDEDDDDGDDGDDDDDDDDEDEDEDEEDRPLTAMNPLYLEFAALRRAASRPRLAPDVTAGLRRIADRLEQRPDADPAIAGALGMISAKLGDVTAAIAKVETAVLALDERDEDPIATMLLTGFEADGKTADTLIGNWVRGAGYAGLRDIIKGPRGAPAEAAREEFVARMTESARPLKGLPQRVRESHLRSFFRKVAGIIGQLGK